ncbi:lysylphosphatidylglycerol synthase transmembrane domain-containing protein [Arcticibacter eurypsychrophilus]|uniref:lysylphosphatidylglycerol synthase transmembrane domain-containing protein n=1 Tax=Arcticibacter eurypsychrophilus TaxID=1434752 RepID=UPI00084D84F6|nr:lysylphosphatidylglycerol synthase transmembrane domain-containing protein [Arcticibacter eurypsychrophilus]
MDKKKLWSSAKVAFKIIVTCLLIYYVFQKIDFNKVKSLFLTSNLWFILLAFFTYLLSQIVSSWRLLGFLKAIGLDFSFGFNFRLYLLGMFYNVFLPGGIGGDGYKVYLLRKKYKLPTKRLLLALFFDRLSGLWAVGFISVSLIIFIPQIQIPKTWPIAALLIGTLIYYLVMKRFFTDYSRHFFRSHIKAGTVQSLQILSVIFILLSHDFTGKFSPYLFSFLMSSIAALVNIGVAGLGVRDLFMAHAASLFDINQNWAVFITFTFWMINVLASLPGLWFVYRSKEFEPLPTEEEAELVKKEQE